MEKPVNGLDDCLLNKDFILFTLFSGVKTKTS